VGKASPTHNEFEKIRIDSCLSDSLFFSSLSGPNMWERFWNMRLDLYTYAAFDEKKLCWISSSKENSSYYWISFLLLLLFFPISSVSSDALSIFLIAPLLASYALVSFDQRIIPQPRYHMRLQTTRPSLLSPKKLNGLTFSFHPTASKNIRTVMNYC
jgi:hypothetical protein